MTRFCPILRKWTALWGLALAVSGCSGVAGISPDLSTHVKPASVVAPVNDVPVFVDDEAIGQREHPKILAAHGGIYRNRKVEAMLARMVGRLVKVSDAPRLRFRVTILNSPSVNAFALPGGYLYITRGLLALAGDLSEVAAVVSHEMAHVLSRHAIARAQVVRNAKATGQAIVETINDPQAVRSALAMNTLSVVSFSRRQELEADRIGIALAARAGFDTLGSPRFLSSLARYSTLQAGNFARFQTQRDLMATHPSTPQRVQRAEAIARATRAARHGQRFQEEYLKSLDGLTYGYNSNEGFVRGNRFYHTKLRLTFSVPRSFSLHNSPKAVVAVPPDGGAIRLDNPPPFALKMGLAPYLRSGWVKGLLPGSVRNLRINGHLSAATAEARDDNWQYFIAVINKAGTVYRMIYAAPASATNARARFKRIINSFRELSATEINTLKPLSLKIVRVGTDDTAHGLAKRMRGFSSDKLKHFLILNGLVDADQVRPGMLVKIAR